jgi:hypothetical protein
MKALSFGQEQVSAEVLQRLLDAEAAGRIGCRSRQGHRSAGGCVARMSNAEQRRIASRIMAPIDGTVVKMAKRASARPSGPGTNWSESHRPARTRPRDGRRYHAPLLNVGRKVKILFYGIPAIPLPAWPELMAGTYQGVIKVIDQVDDGKGNFRFWVVLIQKKNPSLLKNASARGPRSWDGLS